MRKRLQRGWHPRKQHWLIGSYSPNYGLENPYEEAHILCEFDGKSRQVLPETVSDYIGIDDKNGKMIFENQYIKEQYDDPSYQMWKIVFEDGEYFGVRDLPNGKRDLNSKLIAASFSQFQAIDPIIS